MNVKFQLVVSISAVLYTILGGVIFYYIEKDEEEKTRREAPEIHLKWLGEFLMNIICLASSY